MKRVKIRNVSKCNAIVAIGGCLLFITLSLMSNQQFHALQSTTEEYIECEKAVTDLQNASDYLSEEVQLFTLTGDESFMRNYFYEANELCRRENALETLRQYFDGTAVFSSLQTALDYSREIMETDYYAMCLVLEASYGTSMERPKTLQHVTLSEADECLSSEEKIRLAQKLVSDDEYLAAKNKVENQVASCSNSLIQRIRNQQNHASSVFSDIYHKLLASVVFLALMMVVMSLMVRRLLVIPLIKCIRSIEDNETFPLIGADEFQVLAETYNKVYEENKEAQLLIRHKAEHDPMTDLLNRGSFNKILKFYEENDLPFALIIVDVDSFKTVNDTYGHAIGDEILKKVSRLLVTAFRSIDHVCRIGGDEFAIVMVEMTSDLRYTIQEKIDAVNQQLDKSDDQLPKVSLSVGVAFSDREHPIGTIFEDADKALYVRKYNGKAGCSFYE